MPGHKGRELFERLGYGDQLADIVSHDITEIPGADDLRHPEGVIKNIADRYARLYGSRRAFISVNGSSALIMAAIMTCVSRGHKLIAAADSHISVKNGAELAGAEIVFAENETAALDSLTNTADRVDPSEAAENNAAKVILAAPGVLNKESCSDSDTIGSNAAGQRIPCGVSADTIAKLLDDHQDADVVILPSPNYFGIVSDIRSIADEVHKRGKVLIVDQAHGAHLKMFADAGCADRMPAPAEECGADIVVVSTHKTMASFTQTAVADIFGNSVDPDAYEKDLLMLESTSPSYLLMESLAVNADIMEKHGSDIAASWREDLDHFYEKVRMIPGIQVITRDAAKRSLQLEDGCGPDFDDTKIVIDFSGLNMDGETAEKALIEKGIYPEFSAGNVVMCLTGIGNRRQDYDLLLDALGEIAN